MPTIPLFVTHGGGQPVIIRIAQGAFVADLIDAAKAKLMMDVDPGKITLRFSKEPGVALNPRKTLSEAGVGERSDLVVEVTPVARVGACSKFDESTGRAWNRSRCISPLSPKPDHTRREDNTTLPPSVLRGGQFPDAVAAAGESSLALCFSMRELSHNHCLGRNQCSRSDALAILSRRQWYRCSAFPVVPTVLCEQHTCALLDRPLWRRSRSI
jgi:hypothetical protein